jgi:hypothetical protein
MAGLVCSDAHPYTTTGLTSKTVAARRGAPSKEGYIRCFLLSKGYLAEKSQPYFLASNAWSNPLKPFHKSQKMRSTSPTKVNCAMFRL